MDRADGQAKESALLPFADTATRATSEELAYDAAEDSCIVIAHRANARSGHSGLSLADRKQVEKDLKKLAAKLGRKASEVNEKGREEQNDGEL